MIAALLILLFLFFVVTIVAIVALGSYWNPLDRRREWW